MRYGIFLAVAALGLAASTGARADLEITSEATHADGKVTPDTLYVGASELKVDSDRMGLIYRSETDTVITLIKDQHQYLQIDANQMSANMAQMHDMMAARLQSLPEAQRKQVEAMTEKMSGAQGGAPVARSYEKAGVSKTIGAWSCQVFHETVNGELRADLCIAPLTAVGLTQDDLAVFKKFAAASQRLIPSAFRGNADSMDLDAMTKQIGFAGIPVETVLYVAGKPQTTRTVKTVAHATLPPGIFDVPADYTKKAMPAMGQVPPPISK